KTSSPNGDMMERYKPNLIIEVVHAQNESHLKDKVENYWFLPNRVHDVIAIKLHVNVRPNVFFQRNVKGNKGFLQISDAVTNESTEPTLLKSISYIISLSSNNRYSKFIDNPIMTTKELSPD
ncbi:1199_t:CDS:2, partial [Gigaspora rosea]